MTTPPTPAEPRVAPRGPGLVVVGAILVAAVGWFLLFDAWWLNSDGSAYLSLGKSFVNGRGYRLPDGTALAWWDRPAYPILLTAPWFVRESLEASIWMSRLPLIFAAPIVAAGVLRFTRSLVAAAFAGVLAIIQPWTQIAGGSNFVPDGLMAVAVLVAVLAACIAVTATKARILWLLVAFLAVVLASATKETGALGVVLVGIVLWVGFARPRRWQVLIALAALVPVVIALLVVANGEPSAAIVDLPGELAPRMRDEVFAGSSFVVVAAVLTLALVAWALPRCTEPLPLCGLVLIAPGLALGLYASGSGLGLRNAALLPYGACLLAGAWVGRGLEYRHVLPKVMVVLAATVLVVAFGAGSEPRAGSSIDVDARSWDSPATRSVADFLRAHRSDGPAQCTLQFCSFYWLAADGDVDLDLLPQYSARLGPKSVADLDFTARAGFRGPDAATPPCTDHPLVVTKSDERYGTIFECALLDQVRAEKPKYVVVSGWGGTDTFDAGRLIPYLETNPAFQRVLSTAPSEWPRVIAVYEVVGDPQPVGAPTYYSQTAYDALTKDHGAGATLLDGACYAETIGAILARPPGTSAAPGATEISSCPTTLG